MSSRDNRPDAAAALRRQAEEIARGKAVQSPEDFTAMPPDEIRRTLHELRVHQIELEMQNEELRRAQADLDSARARYLDLYDRAPAGYVTISEQGLILEANLTSATLLGVVHDELVKQPLTRFILPADQDIYYRYRKQVFVTGAPQSCEFRMRRPGGDSFWVQIAVTAAKADDGAPVCRIVLSDITASKRATERLEKINLCLLGLGPDYATNINQLTALCGELLGATCALYNRLEGDRLCSRGQWRMPPDYDPNVRPDGHICSDVIRQGDFRALVIRNLTTTHYAAADPNILRYGLKTYMGHIVRCVGEPVGAVCVLFQHDLEPTEDDHRVLGIIASSIGSEEARRQALAPLNN